jgi:uroporphyrinogen decarboxylase
VFPWYEQIVGEAHRCGKPVILHSCGHFEDIIDDIIDRIGFDGRHSYEDAVMPVETAYDRYHRRIAVLGGMDVDFLCRTDPESIYRRSREMLERSADEGAYALGSGNSIPEYLPDDHFFSMIRPALEMRA